MDRVVQIIGLYRQDLHGLDEESLRSCGEIWTINDWYRPYPWLKYPDRVYNLHPQESMTDVPPYRFVNWKQEYKEAISRNVEIITPFQYDTGLNTKLLPIRQLEETFPVTQLQCSIAILMGVAILEGVDKIVLKGVYLRDEEYKYQVEGILQMAEYARCRGIEVEMPYEKKWQKNRALVFDWSSVGNALVSYWMRRSNAGNALQIIIDGVVSNGSKEKH